MTGVNVPITIQVWDSDDGFFTGRNDHVDVNPRDNDKDLNLTYNLFNGQISGDIDGIGGQKIFSKNGKGEIEFTIE